MTPKHTTVHAIRDDGTMTTSTFAIGDDVLIDGGVTGRVIAVAVISNAMDYRVTWWSNGVMYDQYFTEHRLTPVPA